MTGLMPFINPIGMICEKLAWLLSDIRIIRNAYINFSVWKYLLAFMNLSKRMFSLLAQ